MSAHTFTPPEIMPRSEPDVLDIQDLYIDPPDSNTLPRLLAETDDDPFLNLTSEMADRTKRIGVRVIVLNQVEGYADTAARRLEGVDYLLIDSPYKGDATSKRVHDVAYNLRLNNIRLLRENKPSSDDYGGFTRVDPDLNGTDSVAEAFARSQYYMSRDRDKRPVLRTIGPGLEDSLPGEDETIGALRQQMTPLIDEHNKGLFTDRNDDQLDRLRTIVRLSARELTPREQQLHDDISTILANIARKHWSDELTIGVVLDSRHAVVASGLVRLLREVHRGVFCSPGVQFAPEMGTRTVAQLPSPLENVEREAIARGERGPKAGSLKRALLSDYVHEALLSRLDDPEKAMWATRMIDANLTRAEVYELLRVVDAAKTATFFLPNIGRRTDEQRRRSKVIRQLWKHPIITAMRKNEWHSR